MIRISRTSAHVFAIACLSLWYTLVSLSAKPSQAAGLSALDSELFPLPVSLEPNVRFWTLVYSGHENTRVLLHDELHLEIIYAILDFSRVEASDLSAVRKQARRRDEVRKIKAEYTAILKNLAAGREAKVHSEDQARVERLFSGIPGGRRKYSSAIGRLRTQTCLRNAFAEGISRSGLYLPGFERIFRNRSLPIELTRLPFVESLFQTHARSSAQAGGIWQFVPSTARAFLSIEPEFDERYDPFRAADAAARLLTQNYRDLGAWPLAITAYNHGRAGMRRAVRATGSTDLGVISKKYRSRSFGFASRNFYAEFLAAASIFARREQHFQSVEVLPERRTETFSVESYVHLPQLASNAGVTPSKLRELNPAISREVWNGTLYLPSSYALSIPAGTAERFEASFGRLAENHKSAAQTGIRYRVRRGDTLGSIAARFGSSTARIQRANKLRSADRIFVGQRLFIPPSSGANASAGTSANKAVPASHRVKTGESLSSIAEAYGVSLSSLAVLNELGNSDRILVGQMLRVSPASSSGSRIHLVRRGESLSSIAAKYGTSVTALKTVNQIHGNVIQPAQRLVIPN